MARHYLFTSESVTEGHPDKVCDQVSDAVLDAILEQDPMGRVACETTACTGLLHVMGEITTSCYVDIPKIAREVVREIGYDRGKYGFDCDTCAVITSIDEQSPDIAMGVDESLENKTGEDAEMSHGAGDQGMMFGYACDETPELMPLPLSLAQKICLKMAQVRKSGEIPYMRPDGKSQVTVEYDENDRPIRVDTVVISTQHDPDTTLEQIRADMIAKVAKAVIPASMLDENTKYYVNPTGRFVKGGPAADSGLTGRKIIVDTYGGSAPHGGGCFSGKDPTKVDRSAAYAARYVAKTPRWTAPRPTPPGMWPRTSWRRAWPGAARCSWPMPSAWPSRSASWWIPSAPAPWATTSWRPLCARCSTCGPRPSSGIWTCASPSTASWPLTATWAGRTWA